MPKNESSIFPARWLWRRRGLFSAVVALLGVLWTDCGAWAAQQASNSVVVMIDSSGSYKSRVGDATQRAVALLNGMTRLKLRRWEPDNDQITVVSLDALPEVIWHGTLRDLEAQGATAWTERFRARSDYAGCTDVAAAFRLALRHLEGDPRYVGKYLFVFSDLVDEPPTASITACRKTPGIPEDFPWAALDDIAVSAFWLPPNQKLLWSRAVEAHDLSNGFHLYTVSESNAVNVAPIERPTPVLTERDRRETRDQVWAFLKPLWVGLVTIVGGLGLLAGGAVLARRHRLNRRPSGTPGSAGKHRS